MDPLHLGHPVLGDEQVFDVELDRNTQLLPVREDVRKLSWKDEDVGDNGRDNLGRKVHGSAEGDEQGERNPLTEPYAACPLLHTVHVDLTFGDM